jgi:aryl-alcohol dehydrogenase-like predicted oxidoreductase
MSPLPTVPFGSTDMSITRVGFGAWAAGGGGWAYGWGPQDDDASIRAIVHAVDRGVNWVDTASVYGLGHSEVVTGKALTAIPQADRPYVFTKGGLKWDPARPMKGAERVASAEFIRSNVEDSLRRLAVERIDLFQMHWPAEDGTPVEEYWEVFAQLLDAGKVRAIGLSNHSVDMLNAAEAVRHVDSLQPPLSLLNQAAAQDVIPWCAAHNTGVIVYSPMASGVLSGTWSQAKAASLADDDWRRHSANHAGEHLLANLELVEKLRPLAQARGVSVGAIAIAWTLSVPGVTGAIVGARSPAQVDGWVPAGELVLTEQEIAAIDAALAQRS